MRVFYLLPFLLFYSYSFSQTLRITDKKTGEPLELVTISSNESEKFIITDEKGKADISMFANQEKISFSLLGYKTITYSYKELEIHEFTVSLIPSSFNIGTMVVSATRWNQSSENIPYRINSLSLKEVELQNPQTAADMLGTSGEVYIQKSQQGGGSPMIRGFSTNRLLYTVDGVRMNTAIFRSGNIQNVISLDPFMMEKAEVLFGPGSVVYGSDAIGGVMSFHTLTPKLSDTSELFVTGNAVTRYSSANSETTSHIDFNLGGKKIATITGFTYSDYDDLKMGSNGPDEYLRQSYVQVLQDTDVVIKNPNNKEQTPTGYHQINFTQKVSYKPSEKWEMQYGLHYSETSNFSRYDRHLRTKKGLPRYAEWYYGPQKWIMNNLSVIHTDTGKLFDRVNVRLAQQRFEESRISRDFNKPFKEIRKEKVNAYSINIDFTKSLKKHNFFYGAEQVINYVASTGEDENIFTNISQDAPSRYPQSTWSSFAGYFSDQIELNERIMIQLGARYSQFAIDARFDTTFYSLPFTKAIVNNEAITGSAGVVYKANKKLIFSSNIATGFRSPNIDDMGKIFDSEPGSVTVPNPDLKAEYVYNIDAGIAKIFGDFLKVDFTAYYSLLQDALVRRDYTLNGKDSILYAGEMSKVQAIQNAAFARVYGVQSGLEVKLPFNFSLSSNFNYQIGEEELDNGTTSPSRHAAPWFGITKLGFDYKSLSLQVNLIYNGERKFTEMPEEEIGKTEIYAKDENGNPYSPGWYTLNFKAMYEISPHFSVNAGVENITDIRYRPYSSGIVAPGRNVVVSVKGSF